MIYLTTLHTPAQADVCYVDERLVEIFGSTVERCELAIDALEAFDPARGQYNSTLLLARMLEVLPAPGARMIAVTDLDLFIPVLTFVFGEAQLEGSVAIASSHRLCSTFYGLPENPELRRHRLAKEAVHELGHAFGLIHCPDFTCVMHASTSADEVDLKRDDFCLSCRGGLNIDGTTRARIVRG